MKFWGLFQLGVGYEDPTGEFCLAFWCEPCVYGGWGGGGEPVIPQKALLGSVVKLELYLPTTLKGLTYSKCLVYSFEGPAYI